jgi:hypothetical protein
MADIQGLILFCDDVRDETSGKNTIVGVYGTDFLLEEPEIGSLSQIVASFNGRIRGADTCHVKFTVEMLDHPNSAGPFDTEHDFPRAGEHDEWTIRVNLRIPVLFVDGAVLKVIVEAEDFKTDASLWLGLTPAARQALEEREAKSTTVE